MDLAKLMQEVADKGPTSFEYLDGIAEHLWPMLLLTPRSFDKLRAAWPDLSFESQCCIMGVLPRLERHPHVLVEPLREIGLQSKFEYVRYLALQGEAGEQAEAAAAADSSRLVRSAPAECGGLGGGILVMGDVAGPAKDAQEFWQLERQKRLGFLSISWDNEGFAELLTAAIDETLAPPAAIQEAVAEFVLNPAKRLREPHSAGRLWQMVPKLEETAGSMLAHALPAQQLDENTVDSLPTHALRSIARRRDFRDRKLRQKLFLNEALGGTPNYYFLQEIAEHDFSLSREMYDHIRALPSKACRDVMDALSSAQNLELWTYPALADDLRRIGRGKEFPDAFCYVRHDIEERRLTAYSPGRWDDGLRDRQLYLVARELADNFRSGHDSFGSTEQSAGTEPTLPAPLRCKGLVLTGDAWKDFLVIREAWPKGGAADGDLPDWNLPWDWNWRDAKEPEGPTAKPATRGDVETLLMHVRTDLGTLRQRISVAVALALLGCVLAAVL